MVRKVSLFKLALKNFTGTNINAKVGRSKKRKKRILKEKRKVTKLSKELKEKGYSGKQLKGVYNKVNAKSREEKMREAVAKHIIKKRKR